MQECIAQSFTPTLAIVFSSIQQDLDLLNEVFDEVGIPIFGATSSGEFIDGDLGKGSIAALLLDLDPDRFKLSFGEASDNEIRKVAKDMATAAMQTFENAAFIVAGSGMSTDGEMIIRGIEDAAGQDTTIYGGMAGDEVRNMETFVFSNGKISNQGIVLLTFDANRIVFNGRATCGYKPSGTEKTVTDVDGWWIKTIDDQPALDLVQRYSGIKPAKTEKIQNVALDFGVNFPLLLQRPVGDPVIRPILFFNWEEKSIMVNGSTEKGATIRLSLPPDFEVIDEVIDDCREVHAHELREADAVIMFSCIGRYKALGPLISKEIEGVRETYDVPMVGFFSNGEFGRATNGNHEYHNLTCCWVALKEK